MAAAEDHVSEALVLDQNVVGLISKAELDQAIATAHAYPRNITQFLQECLGMATLNEDVADECIYALPPRKQWDEQSGKWIEKEIEGPSVRLAEIVASCWRNCRIASRVIEEGPEFLIAQGLFYDCERNVGWTSETRRRIVNRRGERYSLDMIGVTANAACSIALRNATFKGVPRALWWPAYTGARKVIAGDAHTLVSRRDQALDLLQKVGASRERVLAKLKLNGVADIGLEHLVKLRGWYNAVRDGDTTVEEAFAPDPDSAPPPPPGSTKSQALKESLQRDGAKTGKNGNGGKNGGKTAAAAPDGKLPYFAKDTAIAELRAAKDRTALDEAHQRIYRDYRDTNRKLEPEVESEYEELRHALADRE